VSRPAEPRPATARATMNITEDREMAHSKEPSSKMKKKAKKVL
jgi:hypothetical protein